jgi:transcriptional regulator with XRE-family HTH domain
MARQESWRAVGLRIRQLRKENRLTLRQLALGCDLSANAISLVERGEVAPSIATLCKLSRALGVSAASLFQEVCDPEVVLTRAGGSDPTLQVVESFGGLVCNPLFGVRQTALCLCGHVLFETDEQCYALTPGDSLTFNAEALHRWRNRGQENGVVVLVAPGFPEKSTSGGK